MRISGIELNRKKPILQALTRVFGIGLTRSKVLCEKAGLTNSVRVADVTDEQSKIIQSAINSDFIVEGDLKRTIIFNIKSLIDKKCYRGLRHTKGLPMRARTKTNAQTRKRMKSKGVSKGSSKTSSKGGKK